MRIDIVAAVPESIDSFLSTSIVKNAQEKEKVKIYVHNIHDYSEDRFRHIDDYPYGGGAGMVIKCQPVFDCINRLKAETDYDEVIYMAADGQPLTQPIANELSLKKNILILAGHYKGVDQRIRDRLVTREISIGDYVLSGGELPAAVLCDAIVRLIPGVLGDVESALDDSFQSGLLEPPVYTRPAVYEGMPVPDVLLNGNHQEIKKWREKQSWLKTISIRPDIIRENENE